MIWILLFCVWALAMLCVVLGGRVRNLQKDVAFWREEAIRLNNEKVKWRSTSTELQQKLERLTQELPETRAGYIAWLKRSICEMDNKCPLKDKEEL